MIQMEKLYWSSTDIQKLFRLKERVKSRQTLLNAEERGEIPKAERVPRGTTLARKWKLEQLPSIGERFGFIKKPTAQKIICIYTAKGGVLKTTLAYTLSRVLALNGIKTLIVGLDIQCSITDITLPPKQIESLYDSELPNNFGLYHHFFEKVNLSEIIKKTNLPTLDIIPESPVLNILEKKLRLENRREYLIKDKLIPYLSDYDVVIFDNGPSWNQLIENALTASEFVISPVGCDIGTYQALQTNLSTIFEFQQAMKIEWNKFLLIPTLLEKTKLSQQIYGAYLTQYAKQIIPIPIRRGVKGQEAIFLKQSAIEHDPSSAIAQDYFDLISDLWNRIIQKEEENGY